jgi:hypothetical protein
MRRKCFFNGIETRKRMKITRKKRRILEKKLMKVRNLAQNREKKK